MLIHTIHRIQGIILQRSEAFIELIFDTLKYCTVKVAGGYCDSGLQLVNTIPNWRNDFWTLTKFYSKLANQSTNQVIGFQWCKFTQYTDKMKYIMRPYRDIFYRTENLLSTAILSSIPAIINATTLKILLCISILHKRKSVQYNIIRNRLSSYNEIDKQLKPPSYDEKTAIQQ